MLQNATVCLTEYAASEMPEIYVGSQAVVSAAPLMNLIRAVCKIGASCNGAKIVGNFVVASMHLRNKLFGTTPKCSASNLVHLPEFPTLQDLIAWNDGSSDPSLDSLLAGDVKDNGLLLPLQLALLVSPVLLFVPVQLHNMKWDRLKLIEVSRFAAIQRIIADWCSGLRGWVPSLLPCFKSSEVCGRHCWRWPLGTGILCLPSSS